MTDYKNELEQFDHLWVMGATYEEMKAFIEALLSQHSKKRELEAQIKILARILVHEATGKKRIGLSREGVVRELKRLQEQRDDRIKLTNGQGK